MEERVEETSRWFAESHQRVVRRSRTFVVLPISVFAVLLGDLCWEITRVNVDASSQAGLPWRITLLGVPAAAALTGLVGSLVLARGQFARSVRPSLGWSGNTLGEGAMMGSKAAWTVFVNNGGPGSCVVEQIHYRLILHSDDDRNSLASHERWVTFQEVFDALNSAGLKPDDDFALSAVGPGAPLAPTNSTKEVREFAAFSKKALAVIWSFDARIRANDIVGDTHERIIRCLHAAPLP
ncbi:hypothetical protein [Saccharothrix saharensis]|uniref:hypothetical protein n=1 Tax=Saccharothrix saharensis TaxID=571190 RepID=UPI001151E893|nr:hypothetical protein [Saccharothrix saharensis]